MDQFFKKAVVFTDSHFGRSADSITANSDNIGFLQWALDRALSWGAETCIFMGDWFHNRASIGVSSLEYSLRGLEMLSAAPFERIVCLKGNHDLARRQGRDISSLNFARHLEKIEVIHDPVVIGDVALLPWLLDDEPAMLPQLKARYVFAHLETVGAMMNARVQCMGGHQAIEADTFKHPEHVFSGHFHQRQNLRNITYVGSVMPFDFSDANDSARGAMFLEWGRDPFFESWPEQPLFQTGTLSWLLDNMQVLRPKMTVRASVDVPLRYEEVQEIRETLINTYGLRKVELNMSPVEQEVAVGLGELHTVDEIVIDGLRNLESSGIDNARLIDIYSSLPRV